jgi:hypothetical protein
MEGRRQRYKENDHFSFWIVFPNKAGKLAPQGLIPDFSQGDIPEFPVAITI